MIGSRFINAARRHLREETGASLIEYTVVISLFLLVFFAILDFGRLGFNWVMTEKAMQRAARIATVRPPVSLCAGTGIPATHALDSSGGARFGTLCRAGGCVAPHPVNNPPRCVLGMASDPRFPPDNCETVTRDGTTEQEIWCTLVRILPANATPQNIWVSYTYDPQLGFAGGPYTPMVEVGVVTTASGTTSIANAQELRFEFLTPIPGMAALAGGGAMGNMSTGGGLPSIPFPDMSVSLPGEDLNHGTNG